MTAQGFLSKLPTMSGILALMMMAATSHTGGHRPQQRTCRTFPPVMGPVWVHIVM